MCRYVCVICVEVASPFPAFAENTILLLALVISLLTCPSTSSVIMSPLPMRARLRRVLRAHASHISP